MAVAWESSSCDDEEITRCQREAQTAGRLHHPNIASIHEVDEDHRRQYIAMQFVDGQDLHRIARTDRALLVRLVTAAARALRKGDPKTVLKLFRSASADADRDPPPSRS